MQIDPNWISAIAATAIAIGAFAAWIERKRLDRKRSLPRIRISGNFITVFNRLDEDLEITGIGANCDIRLGGLGEWMTPPIDFHCLIKPKGDTLISVETNPTGRAPVVMLTLKSSDGTLRNKKLPVEMFTGKRPHWLWFRRMRSKARSTIRSLFDRNQ